MQLLDLWTVPVVLDIYMLQNGWTALHLAAQQENVDVVQLLTEGGAQVNLQAEVHYVASTLLVNHCITNYSNERITA